MVEISTPNIAAATPFIIDDPDRAPTIVRPSTPSMKYSGDAKDRISGRTSGIDAASTIAPRTPPIADTVKAAPSARSASPRIAIG